MRPLLASQQPPGIVNFNLATANHIASPAVAAAAKRAGRVPKRAGRVPPLPQSSKAVKFELAYALQGQQMDVT